MSSGARPVTQGGEVALGLRQEGTGALWKFELFVAGPNVLFA